MSDLDTVKCVQTELGRMGISGTEALALDEIRNKNGIYLYRVKYRDTSYVLKYFTKEDDAREILNYSILNSLGIPTIKVVSNTDKSLLLEDISCSVVYRLGTSEDLSDVLVARLIARWYKALHAAGKSCSSACKSSLYRETDVITEENIAMIRDKSGTNDNPVWQLIIANFPKIKYAISELDETLTYNDFYWTNLVVRQDKTAELMFDYNLLGIGYRYGDIRNVCSSLRDNCKTAFLQEYGGYDEKEKTVDDGVSALVNLTFAFQREPFPSWANESLAQVESGELYEAVVKILQFYK